MKAIVTALVLIPIVIVAIFKLDTSYFAALCAAVVLWGGSEWAQLSGLSGWGWRILYIALILAMLWLSYALLHNFEVSLWFFLVSGLWWIFTVMRLWRFQPVSKPEEGMDLWQLGAGVITLFFHSWRVKSQILSTGGASG